MPSGFEVSSREKERTDFISLSNYFHYNKVPYLFSPRLEMALKKHMPDCHEQGLYFPNSSKSYK